MLTINPKYEHLHSFVAEIPRIFLRKGREIYHLRNIIKVLEAPDGTLLNVKRYHVPAPINRLVYSLGIRKPKGQRAWEYPTILASKGIETPEPVAYIEERRCGLLGLSYFISLQCNYGHTLYDMAEAAPDVYEPMAMAVARLAADMHEAEVMHKDFTPGNILWERDDSGEFHFSLVDINRMYFGPVSEKRGVLNLIRLWGPKAFTALIVKEYAHLRGFDTDSAVSMAMEARSRFWQRYLKRHTLPFKVEI